MNICLINPSHEESLDPILDPPLGLLYIAAILKNKGYKLDVIDLSFFDRKEWSKVIPWADIYGISIMTPSFDRSIFIRDICKKINPLSRIIVGGPHPTALPEETSKEFDIVIVGEGEIAFGESIVYINNNNTYPKIVYGKKMDINDIPFPARELVPIDKYTRLVNGEKAISIISGRGCPYSCGFCQNSTKKYGKDKIRFRTIENIIREIKELIHKYDYRTFIFYDDILTIRPDLEELLEEIGKLNITFRCNGNARKDNFSKFRSLYLAGCREIDFGIESGSQKILDRINKKVSVEQNRNAISNAKKAGILVKTFLIVGLPGESWNTIDETINFIKETKPDYWTLFNFIPLPGCQIWDNPEKYGIKIVSNNWKDYFNIQGENIGGLVSETEFMSVDDIRKARDYMIKKLPPQTGPLQKYYGKL